MEMLQGVWKQHLRPHAVVGYGVKIFLPSPPNYVTRSPGELNRLRILTGKRQTSWLCTSTVKELNPGTNPVVVKEGLSNLGLV